MEITNDNKANNTIQHSNLMITILVLFSAWLASYMYPASKKSDNKDTN